MRRTTALIIGGGPAGSAAAIALGKGGVTPLVLERHRTPQDALCGGFMSWLTLAALADMGIAPAALGGHSIERVALFSGTRAVEAKLPSPGMGLSRLRLDRLMLEAAEAAGAIVERGQSVREMQCSTGVRLANGSEISADAVFLATGKHELRGAKRAATPDSDPWMGLRFRIGPSPGLRATLDGTIELHLFAKGYAGLLLQEDGSANLCMALRRSRLAEAGGDPGNLLLALRDEAPSLHQRLEGLNPAQTSDAIGLVPYGWVARSTEEGFFRIGDQAAVIPSLAGEGMGIAIASGSAAGEAFLTDGPTAAVRFQRRFARRARRPMAVANSLKSLTEKPKLAGAALQLAKLPGLLNLASRLTRIA